MGNRLGGREVAHPWVSYCKFFYLKVEFISITTGEGGGRHMTYHGYVIIAWCISNNITNLVYTSQQRPRIRLHLYALLLGKHWVILDDWRFLLVHATSNFKPTCLFHGPVGGISHPYFAPLYRKMDRSYRSQLLLGFDFICE